MVFKSGLFRCGKVSFALSSTINCKKEEAVYCYYLLMLWLLVEGHGFINKLYLFHVHEAINLSR